MIIFGRQCFEYVLCKTPKQIQEIYLSKEIDKSFFNKLKSLQVPIIRIDNKKAQSLSRGRNHQGIIAKINDIEITPTKNLLLNQSLIILCGLNDVGNIGAIVRTAYALGVDGVILCDRNELNLNVLEGIFRASSGALLNMPFGFHKSSLDIANEAKMSNFKLIGSGITHSNVAIDSYKDKWALFIGRENEGLKHKLISKLDCMLHITMYNSFDSLNASVAAGILIDRIQHCRKI